jgi:hypothetical protein
MELGGQPDRTRLLRMTQSHFLGDAVVPLPCTLTDGSTDSMTPVVIALAKENISIFIRHEVDVHYLPLDLKGNILTYSNTRPWNIPNDHIWTLIGWGKELAVLIAADACDGRMVSGLKNDLALLTEVP